MSTANDNAASIKNTLKQVADRLAILSEGPEESLCAHVKSVVDDLVRAALPEFELVKRIEP